MTTPNRGPLTTYLVNLLTAAFEAVEVEGPTPLVGDGIAPDRGGWSGGQPAVGEFVPYAVVKSSPASKQGRQTVGDSNLAWMAPYVVTSWGVVREQADLVGDIVCSALAAVTRVPQIGGSAPLPTDGYGIQQIEVNVIGSVERNDQVTPPMWNRSDNISVWLARARRGE